MSTTRDGTVGFENGKVMCVGLACVDFVNVVDSFPHEDSDKRGERYYWQRGGNATNNCTVLTKLSTPCDFMGVLGTKGAEASWISEDFEKCGVSTVHCVRKNVQCSSATVILSIDSGTRTIIFYPRDQPQLTYEEFNKEFKGDFSSYSWIHFELTSNVPDVCNMMNAVLTCELREKPEFDCEELQEDSHSEREKVDTVLTMQASQRPIVSLEIEKPEIEDAEKSMDKADVVFISKDFAKSRGCTDAVEAVKKFQPICRLWATVICAWGECGAAASYLENPESLCVVTSPALANISVVDSLGAGDSFVAGVIHTLVRRQFIPGASLGQGGAVTERHKQVVEEAIVFGCKVAGLKCTMFGYDGITDLALK